MKGRRGNRGATRNGFTLMELVLAVSILAVLAAFIVPTLSKVSQKARSDVVAYEMGKLRDAFRKLDGDCVLSDSQLEDIAGYGLWPLARIEHPADSSKNIPSYAPARRRGWRGPYAVEEGEEKIDPNSDGQAASGTGTRVPVFRDPYSGYYRVLIPRGGNPGRLVLVCTGPDGVLDTTPDDLDANGDVVAKGDDKVERLAPSR